MQLPFGLTPWGGDEGAGALMRDVGMLDVLVVEDQLTLADSLAVALCAQDGVGAVWLAGTAAEAERLAVLERPDVVVLDLGLPDKPGLVLCRRLREQLPGIRVVVLTGEPRRQDITEAAELGASGFLTKGVGLDTLLSAIRDSAGGAFTVDPALLLEVARGEMPRRSEHRLTPRECDILEMMSRGLDTRGIARELNLSPHTARDYIKVIYRKLGVHSQLEAILTAFRSGELDMGALVGAR